MSRVKKINATEIKEKVSAKRNSDMLTLVITSLFIALTYIFTAFVNVRLPIGGNGGLIHLGNIPLFIAAIVFGKRTGALAGGIGMALFDLLSGWTIWAPFTFVIVGLMGFFVGLITEKESHHKHGWYIFALIIACIIKVVGYYFAELILYHNAIVPLASIPGNLIQVGTAAVVVLVIVDPLNRTAKRLNIKE